MQRYYSNQDTEANADERALPSFFARDAPAFALSPDSRPLTDVTRGSVTFGQYQDVNQMGSVATIPNINVDHPSHMAGEATSHYHAPSSDGRFWNGQYPPDQDFPYRMPTTQ